MSEEQMPASPPEIISAPSLSPVVADGLAGDTLRGAKEIARFLFGVGDAKERRRVYHLAPRLPIFRLGSLLCARRSALMRWIEEQERRTRM